MKKRPNMNKFNFQECSNMMLVSKNRNDLFACMEVMCNRRVPHNNIAALIIILSVFSDSVTPQFN